MLECFAWLAGPLCEGAVGVYSEVGEMDARALQAGLPRYGSQWLGGSFRLGWVAMGRNGWVAVLAGGVTIFGWQV